MENASSPRQLWMATLATASPDRLGALVTRLEPLPLYQLLRPPEVGLVMVRGRMGGTGNAFNLGEMPLTRCVVQLENILGFGYVGGRSLRHGELAALCDALLQNPLWHDRVYAQVIVPLLTEAIDRKQQQRSKTEGTTVNFLTLARETDRV